MYTSKIMKKAKGSHCASVEKAQSEYALRASHLCHIACHSCHHLIQIRERCCLMASFDFSGFPFDFFSNFLFLFDLVLKVLDLEILFSLLLL
ncbi:hypothetical protein SESBI_01982 [Sesbania bispinosa]|nr:hypothetical protein SESBI_01982 [Sesbania bispinosa]